MVTSLPKRDDVAIQETWNLQHLFPTEEAFNQAVEEIQTAVATFEQQFKGMITNSQQVQELLVAYEKLTMQTYPIGAYASLAASVDQTNDHAQMRASKVGSLFAKIQSQIAFVDSELLELSIDVLEEAMQDSTHYEHYLAQLIRRKGHALHPEVEKALAAYSSSFDAPYELYNTTKMADIAFDHFEVDGKQYPLDYVTFEGIWESNANKDLRRAAFNAFSNKLKEYEQTTAKTYDMHLQMEKTTATLRKHDSIFDYLLFDQEVDRSMYDRQIDFILTELAPHMRKYAKLVQQVHQLDDMTFADLKVPLDATYEPKISIEESKKYIDEALAIMGDDYTQLVTRAYEERWIDFAQNIGKSTGAFCSSPYGSHPYILISWTGSMEDVFVLAHELGHAGHFYHAHKHQNVFNSRPSLYFIEAPSTLNEMLVANHLLKNSDDPKFKRWVISSIVSRTYYHNFVTHLLEAAYQREVYKRIDNGENVNATILNNLKRTVLEQFWGDAVTINEGAELTWMRQPHYYMGLYPYTYSAGLTISTAVSKRILKEGQPAIDDWIEVLRAGGTKTPMELANMAGVDVSTEQPLKETIAYIGELIEELVTLTKEIENN